MRIVFPCSNCGLKLTIEAGNDVPCPTCETHLVVPAAEPGPGIILGDYLLEELIGRGGMGEVYRARQLSMDRDVAVKVLPRSVADDPEAFDQFQNEVSMAARLEHPHIVTAYQAGDGEGVHFMAMAYVRGRRRGPLSSNMSRRPNSMRPPGSSMTYWRPANLKATPRS